MEKFVQVLFTVYMDTSGLLMVAKNDIAHRGLVEQWISLLKEIYRFSSREYSS